MTYQQRVRQWLEAERLRFENQTTWNDHDRAIREGRLAQLDDLEDFLDSTPEHSEWMAIA